MNFFFFQAEDGIRDAQESRGLGDVYKRQTVYYADGMHLDLSPSVLLDERDPRRSYIFHSKLELSLIHI